MATTHAEIPPFALRFASPMLATEFAPPQEVVYSDETHGLVALPKPPVRKRRAPHEITDEDLVDIAGGITATGGVTIRFASSTGSGVKTEVDVDG